MNNQPRPIRIFFILLCSVALFTGKVKAAEDISTDSITVSLLTCSPGQEVYEYYGHSALRIIDHSKGEDIIFNYGLFSFNTPNFRWRFMRGDCQYEIGATFTLNFLAQYADRGSFVREQILNLHQSEARRLFQALIDNCQPQNRSYLYNFFYDNCATRIRDQIVRNLDGKLIYTQSVTDQSLRDIVHEYSQSHPWSLFGQDLLLGAEADHQADRKSQQFAPLYLERDLSTARIKAADGTERPLVSETRMLLPEMDPKPIEPCPVTPLVCAIALLVVTAVITGLELRMKKTCWIYDLVLLASQGIVGLIISFMFFFSIHPTVGSNWLILLFNPLPLLFLYPVIQGERKGRKSIYYRVATVWLFLFLVGIPLIPQQFGPEIVLLTLTLLLRSAGHIYRTRRTIK